MEWGGHDSKYNMYEKMGEGLNITHDHGRSFILFFPGGGHSLPGSMKIGGLAPMGFSFLLLLFFFEKGFGWF